MRNKPIDVKKIFAEALEQDSTQARCEYLDQACANDAKLRQKIESLLKSHEKAGDFLEVPPTDRDMILDAPLLAEGSGTSIGPYKLLKKIGEGGMAMVYRAEQERPLRRTVALKIIKPGMDTREVIARFEIERQALVLMDHPHIARVLDAGVTESGRPYFVMELVEGQSITEYCDQHRLNTQSRLELFTQVCQAVHHAHQKGIIHRDLKPSNVLVTQQDGQAVPKVIDFGIAKATRGSLTAKTVMTQLTQLMGTPEYMSPEQAEMDTIDIDTRTDIYSLGVVLYEMLVGALPFDAKALRSAALREIQRIIREEEPLRPSTRISRLGQAAEEIAACRGTNVAGLSNRLSRELEWIPLMALRKERTRRYSSAVEFAGDIKNYLHDMPLLAGPESKIYRLRKAVRRHRIPVLAGTAVALALILGLVVSMTLYLRMHRAINTVSELENQVQVDTIHDKAERLFRQGQYQPALQEIASALETQDLAPQTHLLHAQLLMEVGKLSDAETKLLELIQAEQEIASSAHYLLAQIYLMVDPDKADQHFRLAESLLSQTEEGFYWRGMTAASADEAVNWLSQAIELNPQHHAAYRARALAYESVKVYPQMAGDARILIVLRPLDYLGYALRGIALRETGQYADAVKDHTRAIELYHAEDELPRLYDQRRETHMRCGDYQAALEDARQCMALTNDQYSFEVFAALLALGEYDKAQAEYRRVAKLGTRPGGFFKVRAEEYAFELLSRGKSLDLPEDVASKSPFYHMAQAAEFYGRFNEKGRSLPIEGAWLGDWSPVEKHIAYSRCDAFSWLPKPHKKATPGYGRSFIEVLDLKTGSTGQVTRFGINPVWSPDGKTIAFSAHYGNYHVKADVWVVSSAGGKLRKLAKGTAKAWSQDGKHIYFTSRPLGKLYSIAVDIPNAEPVPITAFHGNNLDCCALSPDKRLIAFYISGAIHIQTFPEGREVAQWETPWLLHVSATQLQWHPKHKTVMINSTSSYNQMGMCLFDIERAEVSHVFNLTRPWCRILWSPDGSRLIVDPDSGEPRLLEIDPEKPLDEVLAPALSTDEFLAMVQERWDRRIDAHPLAPENYVHRAEVAMAAQDYDQGRQDLNRCTTLINEPNDPAVAVLDYWAMRCLFDKRYAEAELWALGRAQLVERFPAHFDSLDWRWHAYAQLMQVYAAQGDVQEMAKWQRKWLEIHAFAPGSLGYEESTGTYTLTGSGRKIGDTWDEFHFAYKTLHGNGSIVAKVEFNEPGRRHTKAGVMIRNSLEPDARSAALLMMTSGHAIFPRRKADLQETALNYFDPSKPKYTTLPRWIKLERRENSFTAQHSVDGVHWEVIIPDASSQSMLTDIRMNEKVYIGLAVTSHTGPHDAARASFSQVSVTGAVDSEGPFTVSQDIGFSLDLDPVMKKTNK